MYIRHFSLERTLKKGELIHMYNHEFYLKIFREFEVDDTPETFEPCNIGHINTTLMVRCDGQIKYVLQKINTSIFKTPAELIENILNVTDFIKKKELLNILWRNLSLVSLPT